MFLLVADTTDDTVLYFRLDGTENDAECVNSSKFCTSFIFVVVLSLLEKRTTSST